MDFLYNSKNILFPRIEKKYWLVKEYQKVHVVNRKPIYTDFPFFQYIISIPTHTAMTYFEMFLYINR